MSSTQPQAMTTFNLRAVCNFWLEDQVLDSRNTYTSATSDVADKDACLAECTSSADCTALTFDSSTGDCTLKAGLLDSMLTSAASGVSSRRVCGVPCTPFLPGTVHTFEPNIVSVKPEACFGVYYGFLQALLVVACRVWSVAGGHNV